MPRPILLEEDHFLRQPGERDDGRDQARKIAPIQTPKQRSETAGISIALSLSFLPEMDAVGGQYRCRHPPRMPIVRPWLGLVVPSFAVPARDDTGGSSDRKLRPPDKARRGGYRHHTKSCHTPLTPQLSLPRCMELQQCDLPWASEWRGRPLASQSRQTAPHRRFSQQPQLLLVMSTPVSVALMSSRTLGSTLRRRCRIRPGRAMSHGAEQLAFQKPVPLSREKASRRAS